MVEVMGSMAQTDSAHSFQLEQLVAPGSVALVVIDVQNDYCHPRGTLGRAAWDLQYIDPAVRRILAFVEKAHRAAIPVIYVRTEHGIWTDSENWRRRIRDFDIRVDPVCLEGSWGSDFYLVSPGPDDRIVVKHRYNAFAFTELELVLRSREIRTLLLAGVATNVCVETTAREGFVRDYGIVLLEDCCASYTIEEQQAALHNIRAYFGTVAGSTDVAAIVGQWTSAARGRSCTRSGTVQRSANLGDAEIAEDLTRE